LIHFWDAPQKLGSNDTEKKGKKGHCHSFIKNTWIQPDARVLCLQELDRISGCWMLLVVNKPKTNAPVWHGRGKSKMFLSKNLHLYLVGGAISPS